ncbi:MAG: DEAD/DEAH box helicase family protein [Bacteroidetes bacterium]|nr:DEAD/DEAH box helicase family protein [Bacteroidota bacterium]
MTYFKTNYSKYKIPISDESSAGFRVSQIGAIHSIGAHFSQHKNPAIVTMPTGTGKTAVLVAACFLLRAKRVLVITPSRLVREQIAEGFRDLHLLRKIGSLPDDIAFPRVRIIKNRIKTLDEWQSLKDSDVVVGIPSSLSPEVKSIPYPPDSLFDLILVDEAHHSPAQTWHTLLQHFKNANHILFTATPFRNDKKQLGGTFIYSYDMKTAYADKVFGKIDYSPVLPNADQHPDITIANAVEQTFIRDKELGYDHSVMIRTGQVKRAVELLELYTSNTNLRLEIVTGQKSLARVKKTLKKLNDKELDGIICVDMLGEGFDFPNLKIAALHTPHRSLAITLQFIGRFARTTGDNVGKATFHAIESEILIEKTKLFSQGSIWQEMIHGLSSERISQEQNTQIILNSFTPTVQQPEDFPDLSLFALRPYYHVKIFNAGPDLDLSQQIDFGSSTQIVYNIMSREQNAVVMVTRTTTRPKWVSVEYLDSIKYELIILYYEVESGYLFICSSKRVNELYDIISKALTPEGKPQLKGVSSFKLNRVLSGLQNCLFYNIGMRNDSLTNKEASYKTIVGSAADRSLEKSDGKGAHRGHWFGKANENGKDITIGLSTASKVWSNNSGAISDLIEWCKNLAVKINRNADYTTGTGIDHLSIGNDIEQLPNNIVCIDWDKRAYTNPEIIHAINGDNTSRLQLLDLDIKVNQADSTNDKVIVQISSEEVTFKVSFSYLTNRYIEPLDPRNIPIKLENGSDESFIVYLNEHLPIFYTASFAYLQGNSIFEPTFSNDLVFDNDRIEVLDWDMLGVDITKEELQVADDNSIHSGIQKELLASDVSHIIYDHGTGEIADYISVESEQNVNTISLFHCKKSGRPRPGARVDDLYDVCGQAVKSANWTDARRLIQSLKHRLETRPDKTSFVRGDFESLQDLLLLNNPKSLRLQIVIVQPGLSRNACTSVISSLLAAADEFIFSGKCARIRIIGSQ